MRVAYDRSLHFNRATKEVTFLLAGLSYTQRATLATLQRVEARFGPVAALINRTAQNQLTIGDLAELLGKIILRDHKDVPKGAALVEAIEPVGLVETMAAVTAFLTYGLSSDNPAPSAEEPAD